MKRETGYYWVKCVPDREDDTEWEIAYYEVLPNRNVWTIMWFEDEFKDDAFIEINETRILSPDEKPTPYFKEVIDLLSENTSTKEAIMHKAASVGATLSELKECESCKEIKTTVCGKGMAQCANGHWIDMSRIQKPSLDQPYNE